MRRYVFQRLLQGLVSVLLMSVVVFGLARATGSPVDIFLSPYATQEDRETFQRELGLDRSVPEQYWLFLRKGIRGDFGQSLFFQESAIQVVLGRLAASGELALAAATWALIIAVPVGILAALRRGTTYDGAAKLIALLGQSTPAFWLGLVLLFVFGAWLQVLPVGGRGGFFHLILPAVTLGWYVMAGIMRVLRSAMLDILDAEHIKLARIKGLPERTVIGKHALKNAAISTSTILNILLLQLLVGSVTVETVFAWPGVGDLSYQAVIYRDYPLLQAIVLVVTVVFIAINLIFDILYAYFDPRIRYRVP